MAKFTDYTEKTEPVDTDLALIYDTPAKVNKKFTFGNLWKWIAKKIVSEGISQLDTTNKTIPGAINELNSKIKRECFSGNSVRFPLDIYKSAVLMGTVNSSDGVVWNITFRRTHVRKSTPLSTRRSRESHLMASRWKWYGMRALIFEKEQ